MSAAFPSERSAGHGNSPRVPNSHMIFLLWLSLRESFCSANLILWRLFLAQDDFAVAHELVVQPQTVFVGGCLAARARRAAEQAHAGPRLKNARRKRTTIYIEFHSQNARVGDPRK